MQKIKALYVQINLKCLLTANSCGLNRHANINHISRWITLRMCSFTCHSEFGGVSFFMHVTPSESL